MTRLDDLVETGLIRSEVPVAALTTYKLGGPARYYLEAHREDQLLAVADALGDEPLLILGRGSNLVVSDAGFPGLVVHLGEGLSGARLAPEGAVTAGAATPMPALARWCAAQGRTGLEFFVGIPGSVGGGVRMNAGCHGVETKDRLQKARVVAIRRGEATERSPHDLDMSYRHTNLTSDEVVVTAVFATDTGEAEAISERMREIVRWRRDNQPGGTLNAGSVFKNPPGDSAGRIIDSLGIKGTRIGGARVSTKHANFFVAEEGVAAQDVYDLVWAVRRRVGEASGIWLEPEIQFAGPFRRSPDEEAA